MDHMAYMNHDLFPTPFTEVNVNGVVDNEQVIDFVYNYMQNSETGKQKHKWGLFTESYCTYSFDRHILDHPELNNLKEVFKQSISWYCKFVGIKNQRISTSWFNYTYDGGKVNPHRHTETAVSCVYYPSFPEGAANLKLQNPWFTHIREQKDYFWADTDRLTPYTQQDYEIQIKEGYMYLFPGWAVHYSDESESGERIVVAANCVSYK